MDEFVDYKNLNTYDEMFEKAHIHVNLKKRIEIIYAKLIKDMNAENIKEKIQEIEKIIK